jgi:TolA-binding protein
MILTLGQAAKAASVSKSTLSRAIKEGRMSATRKEDGAYTIDPSELFRVYPAKSATDKTTVVNDDGKLDDVAYNNELRKEVEMLRDRLRDKDQHIDTLQSQVTDIQQDRDHWRSHAERSTLLLEDLRQKEAAKATEPAPKKKGWFW